MIRYKGINIEGVEFYHLLNQSKEFTSELGKVILASSRLESQLFIYLKSKGFEINRSKATLGYMINHLETKNLIDDNRIQSLRLVNKQRNYLTHNIHALLTDLIDESILERNDLIDSDVHTYHERARQLKENLNGLSEIKNNYL